MNGKPPQRRSVPDNAALMAIHGIDPRSGCDVPKGWMPMVDALLTVLLQEDGFRPGMITQIKSKFCGLRLYVEGVPPGIATLTMRLIEMAESESMKLCQDCGGPSDDPPQAMMGRRLCVYCKGTAAA